MFRKLKPLLFAWMLFASVSVVSHAATNGRNQATSSEDRINAPATAYGAAERPTITDAQREVLRIARENDPKVPVVSVSITGIGKDAQGRWWIQAWTHVSPTFQGESDEQWFVVRSGSGWAYVDRGTGMQRSDYSADIKWENPSDH